MDKREDECRGEAQKINEAIRHACSRNFGVLDSAFLCQSVSVLEPGAPICVREECAVSEVLSIMRAHKKGCVLVTGAGKKLTGIFSERDVLLKIVEESNGSGARPIRELMTRDPIAQPPDITIAFALNLMSQGGFRHLPLVDGEGSPIGIISVKDVVDYIVSTLVDDLLNFEALDHP
jgi:CBS domain-containing protein